MDWQTQFDEAVAQLQAAAAAQRLKLGSFTAIGDRWVIQWDKGPTARSSPVYPSIPDAILGETERLESLAEKGETNGKA